MSGDPGAECPGCQIWRDGNRAALKDRIAESLPAGRFKRIVIKPNWVHHEDSPHFPIRALVTSPEVVEAAVQACLERYEGVEEISVGDVPLQSCEFDRMMAQSGTGAVAARFARYTSPRITFRDWRKERFVRRGGYLRADRNGEFGDPKGYRRVTLDSSSFLEPVSHRRAGFGISDFEGGQLQSQHAEGRHGYLLSGSVLESDLFVNLPKMKTHQKTGLTGALKNLVGCNGEKAFLVHYVKGRPSEGGDEFPQEVPWAVRLQARVRELTQKRSRLLFKLLRPGWLALKGVSGIQTEGTPEQLGARFYLAAGGWHGNDTIWRMVYDLNRIIRYAPAGGGVLSDTPQRVCISVLDGLVAGEGNGPLQPLPVEAGILAVSENPFLLDMVMCRLMGYDRQKIPLLNKRGEFGDDWSCSDPASVPMTVDGIPVTGVDAIEPVRLFVPPPGWRGWIEASEGVAGGAS